MNWNTFFTRLERVRDIRGFSDQSLSIAAGLSRDGIRNWRRRIKDDANSGPSLTSVIKVAEVLDVDVGYLLGETVLYRNPENMRSTLLAYEKTYPVDEPFSWDGGYLESIRDEKANILIGTHGGHLQVVAKVAPSGIDLLKEKLDTAISRLR